MMVDVLRGFALVGVGAGHRVGPAEWLWCTLTDGRLQQMRN